VGFDQDFDYGLAPTCVSTRSKGSLELVGEFLEVRTQVDRGLTIVSRVDRRLGLIKNLGRHMERRCRQRGGRLEQHVGVILVVASSRC
jgi:hypothetical protein